MRKPSANEEEFQTWLTAFRSGQPCLHVFLTDESDSDARLYQLWRDADRRQQKRLREKERIREAQAAQAAAWEAKNKKED